MTTRQFNLIGNPQNEGVTAVITIDGVEVFNGTLTGGPNDPEVVIATGSLDVVNPVDGSDIIKPVSITITSGTVLVGMFQWNYARHENFVYTAEQMAIVSDPASTSAQYLAVFEAVATPPFSSADLDIFTSTDPADNLIKYALIYEHKCLPYIQDPEEFSYGVTESDYDCNRSNAVLNGTPYTEQPLYFGITMTTGDVLTFDTNIFASNIGAQMPPGFTI